MCNRNLSNGDSCTLRLRPGWVKASLTFSHSEARHAGHPHPPPPHHHHHYRHCHEFVHMVELQNVIFFKLSNNLVSWLYKTNQKDTFGEHIKTTQIRQVSRYSSKSYIYILYVLILISCANHPKNLKFEKLHVCFKLFTPTY